MATRPCILVHGSWHGGWCWRDLIPHLEAEGLVAIAPDLPGHGRSRLPLGKVSLARYADHVAEILDGLAVPALVVGHSMAGAVISEVAERRPDKIRALIYLTAFLLPDGVAMAARMNEDNGSDTARHVTKAANAPAVMISAKGLRETIYDRCPTSVANRAVSRVRPQAIAPLMTPVRVTPERFGRVPRVYVECTHDRAITLAMQRRMQKDLPCDRVISLDAGHAPQAEMPERLAGILGKL